MKNFLYILASMPIYIYRVVFSPVIGPSCRYQPTCSSYALEAIKKHGIIKGWALALRRIIRCHPWGGFGYDPVPDSCEKTHLHHEKM